MEPLKPGERRPHPTLANVTLTGPDPIDDYEMPDDVSNPSRFKYVGHSTSARRATGEAIPSASFVAVDDRWVTMTLTDGRRLVLPLDWSARLPHGTPAERNTWRLLFDGVAVSWPKLGEVINVEQALTGRRPKENPETLAQWIEERTTQQERKAG